jgi:hypothetical protein
MPNRPPLRSDFDEAWKELIETHLRQILEVLFPVVAAAVDWSRGMEFLDTELREILNDTNVTSFRVDRLVKVWEIDGSEQWILIHLEIQSFEESGFEERIYHYNHGIHRAWSKQPVTLVILADLNPRWKPCEYVRAHLGCETRFRFVVCKLTEELDRLENDFSLVSVAAKAQIAALRTTGNPEKRLEIRLRLTRSLYDHGFTREEVRTGYRILSWMMRLPRELQLTFRDRLVEYAKEKNMPHLTDMEELEIELATQRGMERGMEQAAMALLQRKFGPLSAEQLSQIESLSLGMAEALVLALLDFSSASDLDNWLSANT